MLRVIVLTSALLLSASPVWAQPDAEKGEVSPSNAPSPASAPAKAGDGGAALAEADRKVCRTDVPTGSRLKGVKTCKSRREREEQRAKVKEQVDRMQRPGGLPVNSVP